MAKPIELIPVQRDPREELKRRVDDAPIEHAEAVLSVYELLGELHKSGTLDLLRGAVGAQDEIVQHAAGLAAQPEAVRAIRNLLVLGKLLGSIDPDTLHRLTEGLPAAAEQRPEENPPSLLGIFRKMSSKESRRALAVAVNVLESVGKGIDPKDQ
jgi:uncharacterized protein YjgD (DUF1641 family)